MLVAEYDGSGTMLRRYVPGQGVDETLVWYEGSDLSSPHWLHTDQQGSVIAATDGSAAATPYAYSVTGEPKGGWSSSAPAFRYTGQVAIASAQIYYYKARMYDPALGRFLQTDPTGYQAGMNLYAYVGNDPINAIDPSGRCQWGSITFPDGSTVSFPPSGSDCDDGAFQDAISRLKDQSDNAPKPALPSQPERVTVTATRGTNGGLGLASAAGAAAPSGVETVTVTGTRILSGLLPWAMDLVPPSIVLCGIFCSTPAGENCGDPTALGCAGHVLKNEPPEARAQRCEENLNRDLATCQALGRRRGRAAYRICEQQAMLRYGNCLAGRDGEGGINAPLPPWGW
jgi:RHS repeat-associated protein